MLRVTKEGVKQGVNLFRINNNNKEMTQVTFQQRRARSCSKLLKKCETGCQQKHQNNVK